MSENRRDLPILQALSIRAVVGGCSNACPNGTPAGSVLDRGMTRDDKLARAEHGDSY